MLVRIVWAALAFLLLCPAIAGMITVADAPAVTVLAGAVLAVSVWFGPPMSPPVGGSSEPGSDPRRYLSPGG